MLNNINVTLCFNQLTEICMRFIVRIVAYEIDDFIANILIVSVGDLLYSFWC